MVFHEYGKDQEKNLCLIHASCVRWDVFRPVVKSLARFFHVYVPALPGYDPDHPQDDFPGTEETAVMLEDALLERGVDCLEGLYGLSMGVSIALCMLRNNRIHVHQAIVDGGILPYTYPKWVRRCIAHKDAWMIEIGKKLDPRWLARFFTGADYGKDDIQYLHDVLQSMIHRTIWNTFYTCNNYMLPRSLPDSYDRLIYWYGSREKKARRKDLAYLANMEIPVPTLELIGLDHGELLTLHPEKFVTFLSMTILRNDMMP